MWRAKRWLEDNIALIANARAVVHGDFNLRNLLLGADDGITSVLDWEFAHVGHPAEDLGYLRPVVDAVMPWEDFVATYRKCGGGEITAQQIAYFGVWGLYRNVAIDATVQNVFLAGQTSDVFLGATAITYYPQLLMQLTEALERLDA
jgi:aminoglycoside phosphotransferase (APT) family kinase protein